MKTARDLTKAELESVVDQLQSFLYAEEGEEGETIWNADKEWEVDDLDDLNEVMQSLGLAPGSGDEDIGDFEQYVEENIDDPDLKEMFRAYVRTALFNSSDESGEPLEEHYSVHEFSRSALDKMRADCWQFLESNSRVIARLEAETPLGLGNIGNDFWLTRNGHGAGFWDGDYPEWAETPLDKSAKAFGAQDVFVNDEGLIDVYPG